MTGLVVAMLLGLLGLVHLSPAAEFACAAGDVTCLITAIQTANGNGAMNTISLAAGLYTLTTVDNDTNGPTGLPSVTSALTLRGPGAQSTVIERAAGAPRFRLVYVTTSGTLTLEGLTVKGGDLPPVINRRGLEEGGGGLRNRGTVSIVSSLLTHNAASRGGGLYNSGTLTLTQSLLSANIATGESGTFGDGGGLLNDGTLAITNSTLRDNMASGSGGGLYIATSPIRLTITNSTLSGNMASGSGGGLYIATAGLTITNSTLYGNMAGGNGGGVFSAGAPSEATLINSTVTGNTAQQGGGVSGGGGPFVGAVTRQTTIVAGNAVPTTGMGPDCYGPQFSGGHNLTGDATGCFITVTDLTGDPNFGAYADNGVPGQGYVPLHPTSLAIDAGDPAACPATDQLGQPRVGPCDIGAIEFQPETVTIHRAVFADPLARLFVAATSSAPPDAALVATVPGCLANEPMLHLGSRYVFLRNVGACGNLNGQVVTVTSTYGGSASAPLR
jgi:hypothetical protein